MIEERAVVSRVESAQVWVRPFGGESCSRCQEGRGCGGGVIGRLVGRNRAEIAVELAPGLAPRAGDVVVVAVDEQAMIQAALLVYGLPLIGLLAGGVFAHTVLEAHDLIVAAYGALGLLAGFALTRSLAQSLQHRPGFKPRALRLAPNGEGCARLSDLRPRP